MKSALLEKLRTAVEEWAKLHGVEAAFIDAKPTGLDSGVHVLLVARRGFEKWSPYERHKSLFSFLHQQANGEGGLFIRLSMMTEEEYEQYQDVEV